MEYVKIVTPSSIMVMNIKNGDQITINVDDSRFDAALELIKSDKLAEVLLLDVRHIINSFGVESDDSNVIIKVEDGYGSVTVYDTEYPLASAIVTRIIKMHEQGMPSTPLGNFIANLYFNPSSTAVQELYGFIESCELPITEDGHFIAYKIVKSDYMDIYTGRMDNSVGKILSMPRNMVDDNRDNTCSYGLHFCSKEYLNSYGTASRNDDRCLLVKINPADVVSIPSDYNNAKGRTWKYEVVGEIPAGWRDTLPKKDYTSSAVVSNCGTEVDVSRSDDYLDYECGYEDGAEDRIYYCDDDESVAYSEGYDDGYRGEEELNPYA